MAAASSLLLIFREASGVGQAPVIVPSVPGLEYTLPENRGHYLLPTNRMHYAMPDLQLHYIAESECHYILPDNRMHYALAEEDN